MLTRVVTDVISRYLDWTTRGGGEEGFEIAQSMGIALLGLVVAAVFARALEALGVDVISGIRSELGL